MQIEVCRTHFLILLPSAFPEMCNIQKTIYRTIHTCNRSPTYTQLCIIPVTVCVYMHSIAYSEYSWLKYWQHYGCMRHRPFWISVFWNPEHSLLGYMPLFTGCVTPWIIVFLVAECLLKAFGSGLGTKTNQNKNPKHKQDLRAANC